jgi:hypothetical protein
MSNLINNISAAIQTVTPSLTIGDIQFSADKRSTKEAPIVDAERIRRVVIPATTWGELAGTISGDKNQSLTDVLKGALVKLGNDRLRDILAESPMQRTVLVEDFTVANLLKWSEETAASRGSYTFTREDAEKWITGSVTMAAAIARWTAAGKDATGIKAMQQFLTNRIGALAAKNHGLKDVADVTKLVAMIEPADTASNVGTEIIGRLTSIEKQLTAKANEATVSMADL